MPGQDQVASEATAVGPSTSQRITRGLTLKRVEWHLWNWERWQNRPEADGDYPSKASSGLGRSSTRDFDEMADAAEVRCAEAVDVVIEELPPALRAAVRHMHGIAVFRCGRLEMVEAYTEAKLRIGRGLALRGIV